MSTARHTLLQQLATQITDTANTSTHPTRVAIDGVDASGKTMLANKLAPYIEQLNRPVIRASIDGFHNPTYIRRQRGSLSPEGYYRDSFNHAALIESLLQPLGPSGSLQFKRRVFDFRTDSAIDAPLETAPADAILLLDGVFLLRPELRAYFDFSIFVRADFEVTTQRAETRDLALFGNVEEIRNRYQARYVPGQRLYLAEAEPERWATVIVDNNDWQRPFVASR